MDLPNRTTPWLASPKSSSLTLHILDDLEHVKLSVVLRLLQSIQFQTILKINCSKPRSDVARKIIQLLATPVEQDGHWHIPYLHTLLLFGYATKLDFLVSMIKKRYSASCSISRPIALETFTIKGPVDLTGGEKRIIRGLPGKNVFQIQGHVLNSQAEGHGKGQNLISYIGCINMKNRYSGPG